MKNQWTEEVERLKAENAALEEKLRLSELRGDSLDRVVGECVQTEIRREKEIAALTADFDRMRKNRDGLEQDWYEAKQQIATLEEKLVQTELSASKQIAALNVVVNDNARWMREMLEDYKIKYDDHSVGRRVALNTFIHSLREQIAALKAENERLKKPKGCHDWADKYYTADALKEARDDDKPDRDEDLDCAASGPDHNWDH